MTGFGRAVVLLGVLVWAAPIAAQAAPKTDAKTDPAVRELLRLEDSWAAALVKRDGATFQRLLAPGFVYTEDDKTVGRDQVLKDVISPTDSVIAANNAGMQVHLFGPTGVVTGWLEVKVATAKGPVLRRYRFTDTWTRGPAGWQIVAAHDYLVPTK